MTTIAHDLAADELAFLAERLRESGASRWRRIGAIAHPSIRMADGEIVEATADGAHDMAVIVRAVHGALSRRYERASAGAKRAAVTRAARQSRRVYAIAKRVWSGEHSRSEWCTICGRLLTDAESIKRGVGSECWQQVLEAIKRYAEQPGNHHDDGPHAA